MNNSILLKIESWKKRNDITAKPLYTPLLESYRRVMKFKKGDFSSNLILLAYPSKVKQCKKWLTPYSKETPKVLNWYKLTEEGKNVLQDLNKSIGWNSKEMNDYFFNL